MKIRTKSFHFKIRVDVDDIPHRYTSQQIQRWTKRLLSELVLARAATNIVVTRPYNWRDNIVWREHARAFHLNDSTIKRAQDVIIQKTPKTINKTKRTIQHKKKTPRSKKNS